jgi:predicted dehydrogenase
VDKPIAGSLTDAVAIFQAARHYGTPVFSSSSLRWIDGAQEVRGGSLGSVLGADVYSPCSLEATHPDLFWYGIHGVETLFTVMGKGCRAVTRTSSDDFDVVVGLWEGGRIGTFRGIRKGAGGYGGTVFGEKGKVTLERYGGYQPLVEAIVHFFRTGEAPVAESETLEIYAFMEAADESKRQGGGPVLLESVLVKAGREASEKLKGQLE